MIAEAIGSAGTLLAAVAAIGSWRAAVKSSQVADAAKDGVINADRRNYAIELLADAAALRVRSERSQLLANP